MNDPLASFRRKPVARQAEPPKGAGPDAYVAFDAKDRVERLKIHRAMAPSRSPVYSCLLDISYDGPFGTNFVLLYPFIMVLVRGRNLQPVISALQLRTCDFIQEFDPERWEKPADTSVPFIESIEVVVTEKGEAMAEAENITTPRKPH